MTADGPVIDQLSGDRYWPLPRPLRPGGGLRRVGVELEFAGMDEAAAAELVQRLWGGRVTPAGTRRFVVTGGGLGDVKVELDTALSDKGAEGLLVAALGPLVPVEVVTPPLPTEALPEADRLVTALRAAGARGTRESPGFGFGLHLNPEIAAPDAGFIVPVARAYALLEDWLRATDPVDPTRQLLPFVKPWPRPLIDGLAGASAWGLDDLIAAYLELSPSRNRGLDLLPLFEHLDPHRVQAALPEGQAKGGRPTFHFRLPEARVDEPRWSVAYEWNRWVLVERVAARPDLLEALAGAWRAHRASLTSLRGDWAVTVEGKLRAARIGQA